MKIARIFKIKRGKLNTLREWGRVLMAGKYKEAQKTLTEEGYVSEFFHIFELNDDAFALSECRTTFKHCVLKSTVTRTYV
jgi:predicted SAM-dependent methyltransferase